MIAGKASAVKRFFTTFEARLFEIGLDIVGRKTEVAPACVSVQNFSSHEFEGCAWVFDGNIKLLGAAIGTRAWCESLHRKQGTWLDATIRTGPSPFCAPALGGLRSPILAGLCLRRFKRRV